MNEAEVLGQLLQAGLGTLALIALITLIALGIPALRIFNSQQKRNGDALTTLADLAKDWQRQNAATQRDLDSAQAELVAERTTNHERVEMLARIMENVARMARDAAEALSRQEGKLDHIVLTTDRVDANSAARLEMLRQITSHQTESTRQMHSLNEAMAKVIDIINRIDAKTDHADLMLRDVPTTLDIIKSAVLGKIEDSQKLSAGTLAAVADG